MHPVNVPVHKIQWPATCLSVTMDVPAKYCLNLQFALGPSHTPCKCHNIYSCFSSDLSYTLKYLLNRCVKVKLSLYRRGQARRVPGG